MATHNIFEGGLPTNFTFPPSMLPSKDVPEDLPFDSDQRRSRIDFSLTRRLVFKDYESINKGCPNDAFSAALSQWWDELAVPLANGDILNTHIMPRRSSLLEIEVWVNEPVPGMTLALQLRGNAASVGGPVVIAPTASIGAKGGTIYRPATPIYFDQNDMLQVVLAGVNLPLLRCANIEISPVIREYCRGYN